MFTGAPLATTPWYHDAASFSVIGANNRVLKVHASCDQPSRGSVGVDNIS
jgi:hypothetical protein